MATRTGNAVWEGTLKVGTGRVLERPLWREALRALDFDER